MVLDTSRLVLRKFTRADANDLARTDSDARVMRYLGNGLQPRTRDEIDAALARMEASYADRPGYGPLHASRRDDGRFVGACGLFKVPEGDDIEIAYRLPFDCWGQGYATEMAAAVLRHGFETLKLDRIIGLTWPENLSSQRVLVKIGMLRTGIERHYDREMVVFAAEGSR